MVITSRDFDFVSSRVVEELFVDELNNMEMSDESNAMSIGEAQGAVGNSYLMAHGIIKYSAFANGLHCTEEVQKRSLSRLQQRK